MSKPLNYYSNKIPDDKVMELEDKFSELSKEHKILLISMLTDIMDDHYLADTPVINDFYEMASYHPDSDILAVVKWLINSIKQVEKKLKPTLKQIT